MLWNWQLHKNFTDKGTKCLTKKNTYMKNQKTM
ncbi:hypothetical protein Poras_1584 [Porphyromonas asaccharolytica DSM 20707]|uniref:Uncharacterized protein n=1 Tax=Porphyromonas asaccharolytica (strain ATCC 25260 / DSM 20707 / BCRC 10618 / CCUG 7834 / JCM 6326 / LMG 13178 / VPI 4198 / B440) TaxID=879243 RepID=F4KNR8_PORAD|nr:hypothetical protein Poras_1584 [Porphyromonas asaccharolytica DSM 20707]